MVSSYAKIQVPPPPPPPPISAVLISVIAIYERLDPILHVQIKSRLFNINCMEHLYAKNYCLVHVSGNHRHMQSHNSTIQHRPAAFECLGEIKNWMFLKVLCIIIITHHHRRAHSQSMHPDPDILLPSHQSGRSLHHKCRQLLTQSCFHQ